MATTVLDSTDLPAILADAGVTLDQPEKPQDGQAKPEAKPADKPATAAQDDPDDIEDENGLTAAEREGLTERMQKAIGKQYRKRKEAEEFAAAQYNERQLAVQRAAQLEREFNDLKGKLTLPAAAPEAPKKPVREDFAGESEYVDAMIQWGVDQRLAEKAEEDRQAAAQRERDKLVEAATSRVKRAGELVPDFSEVVGAVDTEVPPAVAGYMQKSEMFAEIAYHLAKNPDVLVSLAKLPPDEQLVKIGRIESNLSPFEPKTAQHDDKSSKEASNGQASKPAPSADTDIDLSKPRGKAAPVITPLEGTGSAGVQKDSKDMNIREAIEDYSKRNRLNLGVRKRH